MYYENFEALCNERGVKPGTVSKATGVSTATLTNWKKGNYTPKSDKLKLIADYFGVDVNYLLTGQHPEHESTSGKKYYFSDETAETAQELFENPALHALMDAGRGVSPETLKNLENILWEMKRTNPDG